MTAKSQTSFRSVNPWLIALAVISATFMEVLDTTITNVALPQIAGNLSASTDEATWVLTSYLVSNAIILPMTGWLANYFGRKRVLLASIAGFTLSSLACGLSPNLPILIFCRIVQGATGGGLQPFSQAIMLEVFPGEKQGKAMAAWLFAILIAPLVGPVFGGWIVDHYSWRWIFYVNIPIGLISLLLCQWFVFDPAYIRRTSDVVDSWGIGFLVIGIGSLQVVLDKGQQEDWFSSNLIIRLSVLAVIGLVLFVIREFRTEQPVVDLRAFRDRNFSTGVLMGFVTSLILYGTTVIVPLFFQTMRGYPAMQAGIATVPRGIGSMLAMVIVGGFLGKLDGRPLMALGLVIAGWSTWGMGYSNLSVGSGDLWWPQFWQGISMGLIFVPLTTLTYATIAKEKMGNATSLFNLLRNIGGSVGISVVTTIIARHTQTNTAILGSHVHSSNRMATAAQGLFISKGFDFAIAAKMALASIFGMIQQQAWMLSFIAVAQIFGVLFVVIIPLVLLMRKPQHHGGGMVAH
jgi:DHA2 family multidrug resistance protein